MTESEAHERILTLLNARYLSDYYEEPLKVAALALLTAIPEPPIPEMEITRGVGREFPTCPRCGAWLDKPSFVPDVSTSYCPTCGKAIEWKDYIVMNKK